LIKLANSRQFDPLDASKWYFITREEIVSAGGNDVLNYYEGSHITALRKLYPELILKKESFLLSQEGWKAPAKQRKFFDNFANSKQFDPLDAEQWYTVSQKEILNAGGGSLLQYHKGSHIKALVELYPELNLRKESFLKSKERWIEPEQHRKFFDKFAQSKQFDPLDAEKWYSITRKEITSAGGRGALSYYEDSHIKALVELYPELNLKKDNFLPFREGHRKQSLAL